jgi:hypothetical protein
MNRREFLALTSFSAIAAIQPSISRSAAVTDVETGITELENEAYEETQDALF